MDGVHDLGGTEGFGPVEPEANEPVFHAEWERRAFGLTFATFLAGVSNGGEFRHSIERMGAPHYLTSRYYEHWVTGVATRFVETGRVEQADLERRAGGPFPLSRPVAKSAGSTPEGMNARLPGTFAVGDRVRVRAWSPRGHTRCPGYVRGRRGTVVRVDGPASLPDVEAHGPDHVVEPVCTVEFGSHELWQPATEPPFVVRVDLWTSYLEALEAV